MSDDRCPEHDCDIAVCFEEHNMKGEEESMTELELEHLSQKRLNYSALICMKVAEEIRHLREEIASLKTEAERDKSAARLAFDTLAEERDHLRAERERHIEAAAHKELDWFAEKRRADLLEAKCAELWQLLETVKYRIDLPAPNISGSNGLRKLLETLPNNPGQLLLDRLRRADLLEAKCAEMASVLRRTRHRLLVMVEADGEDALYADEIKAVDATLKDNPGQPLLERLAWLESQNRKQLDYSIALQRLVEHICHVGSIPEEIAKDCPHHAEMARKHLKWLEKLERVREHAAMSFKRPFYKPDMELGKALAACKEVKP